MFNRLQPWPPPYTIIRLKRARHVKVKVSLQKGLEIVVPVQFNEKDMPKLLKINKPWILKKLTQIYQEIREIRTSPLPAQINLAAVRQCWKVRYKSSSSEITVTSNPKQKTLTLTGKIKNKWECLRHLNTWVEEQAQKSLIAKLKRVSRQTGLPFTDAIIRNQSSRWASCTLSKRIYLNYKLIFLPATLCKHIFIHELCHTVHLNHSKKFWRLVAKHDAHWEKRKEDMQNSEKFLPPFAKVF